MEGGAQNERNFAIDCDCWQPAAISMGSPNCHSAWLIRTLHGDDVSDYQGYVNEWKQHTTLIPLSVPDVGPSGSGLLAEVWWATQWWATQWWVPWEVPWWLVWWGIWTLLPKEPGCCWDGNSYCGIGSKLWEFWRFSAQKLAEPIGPSIKERCFWK